MNSISECQIRTLKLRVLGAGPAGLTAAYEAQKFFPNGDISVFEASEHMGGIARTEEHKGYRFDIGGHRFFTKEKEVNAFWAEILGDDFITVPRKSRIFYKGKFFDYPLRLVDALSKIGPYESLRILASYVKWQVRPHKEEDTFEEWVMNRFGGRLYMHFFRTYTEKVWGIPANTIRADWAAQRIKNLTLRKAVWNAVFGTNDTASLIEEFQYPRLGPGMMWDETAKRIRQNGGTVETNSTVVGVRREGMRIVSVDVAKDGNFDAPETIDADEFISTLALRDLINMVQPPPPQDVLDAANRMKYRDFLIVTLVLDDSDPFPDNWIYVHSPEVRVGRIQNFRAWSEELLPNKDTASIGMEYFCNENDSLWQMDDASLVKQAGAELEKIGLSKAERVTGGFVIRQRKAYPVYDPESKEAVDTVSGWLQKLTNFQTVGRNGLHRYNNQDHSMLTAMYAARNLAGAAYDIWDVNLDRSYHEEMEVSKEANKQEMKEPV